MISVVMPVYNAQKYLEEAIKSILNQTYKDFEFIIINDGSTDKSLDIIEKYKNKDGRIVLISRENMGLVHTLNEGINVAKGKYIARMDADDISLSQRFEKQVDFLEERDLDICGSHYLSVDEYNNINGLNLTPLSHKLCFLSLASKVPFAHPSVLIRKSFLKDYNLLYGQSEFNIAEDFDLWMRMYQKGAKFGNVNEILFYYRVLNTSLSKLNNKGILKDTKKMTDKFFKQNKKELITAMKSFSRVLNDEEKSLLVRFVFRLFLKTFNFSSLKYIKHINKKIIICSILSEIHKG